MSTRRSGSEAPDDHDGPTEAARHGRRREAHTGEEDQGGAGRDGRVFVERPGSGEPAVYEYRAGDGPLEADGFHSASLMVARYESSGPLPPAAEFNQLPKHVQDKVVDWADKRITGAESRADALVKEDVAGNARSQWLNFIAATVPTVASFAAFVATRDPLSFTFLAIPGVTIAVNVIGAVRGDGAQAAEREDGL